MDKNLLIELLGVPSYIQQEYMMVSYLQDQLQRMGIPYYVDEWNNVYATKGAGPGFYPLVCAHTDTVHPIRGKITIKQVVERVNSKVKEALRAFDDKGYPTGCGGDDKAGIFVCLELLKNLPRLKVAFFATEEIGCVGSRQADPEFFKDVGYCIEWDSPNGDIVTFSCDGVPLFNHDGAFAAAALPIMDEHGMDKWQHHPYTDVAQLRRKFKLECLNLPCGYYRMHSSSEFVVLSEVENAIDVGMKIITAIKNNRFLLESSWEGYPKREITGLRCS